MHAPEQGQLGARALFAALAATDSDEAALARFTAMFAAAGHPTVEHMKALLHPPAAEPVNHASPPIDPWKPPLERVLAAAACVGRLESVDHDHVELIGTAWMVRPDIAVTRRRPVAVCLTQLDRGERTLQIGFGDAARVAEVREVLYLAPDCDLAFLRVAPQPDCIELAPSLDHGRDLAVLGPAGEPVDAPPGSGRYSQIAAGKWLAPGRLREIAANRLRHDCAHWPRAAGGVVIDLERGQAVGLALDGPDSLPAWLVRDHLDRRMR